jgi:hypothetical protein
MSNEKQTAVEWLEKNMWEHIEYKPTLEIQRIRKKIQQAKEMERDMLTDAYHDGKVNGMDISHPLSLTKEISAKEYYEKTYGGNK